MFRKASISVLLLLCLSLAPSAHGKDLFAAMGVLQGKGEAAPFALNGVDGKKRALDEYKGKLVLLNFWATWCGPCRDEMPALERLWDEYRGRGFVVVAIAGDKGNMHGVKDFCKMHDVSFPVLLDQSGEVKDAYGVTMMPTSFVIGRDGLVKGKIVGPREWDGPDSRALFDGLLK